MSLSTTNFLKFADYDQKDLGWYFGWKWNQQINDVSTWQANRKNYVVSGGALTYAGTGLFITIAALVVLIGETETSIAGTTLPLTPGTADEGITNFVYIDSSFVARCTTTPPPADNFVMLGMVATNDADAFIVNDLRQNLPQIAVGLRPPAGVDFKGGVIGMDFSNSSGDTVNDITLSAGTCFDSTGIKSMTLSTAMTKRADAVWSEGNNAGGVLSGSKSPNNLYNIYAIRNDLNGVADIGFLNQTLAIGSNLPAGYSAYRLIGFFNTEPDSTNNMQFLQNGDYVTFSSALDCGSINAGSPTWFTFPATRIPNGATLLHLAFSGTGSYVEVSSALSSETGPDWFFNAPVGAIWPSSSGTDRSHWVMLPETKRLSVMTRALPANVHVKSIQFIR